MLLNFLRNFCFLLPFIALTGQAMENQAIHQEDTLTPSGVIFRKLLLGNILPSNLEKFETFQGFKPQEIESFFQKIPLSFKYFPEKVQEGLIKIAKNEEEEEFVRIGDDKIANIEKGITILAEKKLEKIVFDPLIFELVSLANNDFSQNKKITISREEMRGIGQLSQWDIFQVALNSFSLGEQCEVLSETREILSRFPVPNQEIKTLNRIQQNVFNSITILENELENEKARNKAYEDELTIRRWQDIQATFNKNSSLYNLIKIPLEAENKAKDYTPDKFCDAIQAHAVLGQIWLKDPNKQKTSFKVILTQEAKDNPLVAYQNLRNWFDQNHKTPLEEFIKTWQ